MRVLQGVVSVIVAVVIAIVVIITATIMGGSIESDREQVELNPFYQTPSALKPGKPGDIIRQEKMVVPNIPENAEMFRILYRTQDGSGKPRISSGFVVTPKGAAPKEGRKILAWAHGTTGMGDPCAPSRTDNPLKKLNWIEEAIDRGYVVTATDYAGLGTEGPQMYLIGQDEARDIINSVRAARNLAESKAGTTYAVLGHSQGGNSSLWTGHEGPKYAPELKLVGVAGLAPASDLVALVQDQWDKSAAWAIGPEILSSFKIKYPRLPTNGIVSELGMRDYKGLSSSCITNAAIQAKIKTALGQDFFISNPLDNPAWRKVLEAESVKPLPATMPAYIAEIITDDLVTPASVIKTQHKFCRNGSQLWTDWLGPSDGEMPITSDPFAHSEMSHSSSPLALNWLYPLYRGEAPFTNCQVPPAVTQNPPAS